MIHTKIVATLGPASSARPALQELIAAGVDVCRLNFSHGELAEHTRVLADVRAVARECGRPVAVLGDLCGPKIRLNSVPGAGLMLETGQRVRFVRGAGDCTADALRTNYAPLIDEVEVGQRIYIDDGLVRLLVADRSPDELICTCTAGGRVSSHKGVNLPDTRLSVPALTEKDRRDLEWAVAQGVDYVALSFVRRPEDVHELRALLQRHQSRIGIIAKIEKREALERIDEIIAAVDGIMVARGDLGVEMDVWRVPVVQKDLVARCRAAGKPVIVATQMLQSMVTAPMPTRAEVSDVANAIFDQADAVMLSAETAVGAQPAGAVDMMRRIAEAAEAYLGRAGRAGRAVSPSEPEPSTTAAIVDGAAQTALDLGARLVAAWSSSGATVRLLARQRLPMPVVGLSGYEIVCRQMNLLYGVVPLQVEPVENPKVMVQLLDTRAVAQGLAREGDVVVVVLSTRPTVAGATDTVLVHRVGDRPAGT